MTRIAVPNKGTLSAKTIQLFQEAGYRCDPSANKLVAYDNVNGVEFVFLRPRDITTYVCEGVFDFGVTGRDIALDSQHDFAEILPLDFGRSKFCFAVPRGSDQTIADMKNLRVATSFPHIVATELNKRGIEAKIVYLEGAVEGAVRLGIADAIADVVETGSTLAMANLQVVGDPIMESEAILIAKTPDLAHSSQARILIERIRGVIIARQYVMVEYDVEERLLARACEIAPGIESPTVAPLHKAGWFAVKAMVKRAELHCVMDQLQLLGAKGILATQVQICRL